MSKREREKALTRKTEAKEAAPHARLTKVRMSARKIRAVATNIVGKSVTEALSALAFSTRAAARPLRKLIHSAVANADAKGGMDLDALMFSKVQVDAGPMGKKFMPRAMGRATRIRKHTAHITVWLGAVK